MFGQSGWGLVNEAFTEAMGLIAPATLPTQIKSPSVTLFMKPIHGMKNVSLLGAIFNKCYFPPKWSELHVILPRIPR